ncbi:MAG: hypothetical protein J0H73_11850 [Salana multivorans]|uniref:hypothetical protein n=1 Tax=Salana multivorans TaxID=120377 RepID=UPI00096168A6|nr:hypothetical protein [Salana multivorans]MBN8882993.1 hypothetical protein [Salana multivorans]OJX94055.1 MAG: hypothetical protein BGO96_09620 [Micrococcales bacterium 73-15]
MAEDTIEKAARVMAQRWQERSGYINDVWEHASESFRESRLDLARALHDAGLLRPEGCYEYAEGFQGTDGAFHAESYPTDDLDHVEPREWADSVILRRTKAGPWEVVPDA